MRATGIVLIILAVAAAALTGVNAWRDYGESRLAREGLEKMRKARKETVGRLSEVRLRYKGYQESLPNIPDSLKMAQSGIIMNQHRELSKRIRVLTMEEKEQSRLIRRREEETREREGEMKRSAGISGAVALVLLVGGIVLVRRS